MVLSSMNAIKHSTERFQQQNEFIKCETQMMISKKKMSLDFSRTKHRQNKTRIKNISDNRHRVTEDA